MDSRSYRLLFLRFLRSEIFLTAGSNQSVSLCGLAAWYVSLITTREMLNCGTAESPYTGRSCGISDRAVNENRAEHRWYSVNLGRDRSQVQNNPRVPSTTLLRPFNARPLGVRHPFFISIINGPGSLPRATITIARKV